MNYLDLTFAEPAENLACDEALLIEYDRGAVEEPLLRLWQAERNFVVLGHSNRIASETHVAACLKDGIPLMRRISGGGAVLQGPGCLSYSLIWNAESEAMGSSVAESFRYVLERHCQMIQSLMGLKASVEGISDLALVGKKFSGNAQYRKRRGVLVHGTFLLNFELPLIERYLAMPSRQPAYRRQRGHADFVMNLQLDPTRVCAGLIDTWRAERKFTDIPWAAIERLAHERYRDAGWLRKF